jgi:hypothetical protein
MKRFKNILLVLDPESQGTAAFDKAVSLAKQNDARLTLFSVVYKHPDLHRYPDSVGETLLIPFVSDRQHSGRGTQSGGLLRVDDQTGRLRYTGYPRITGLTPKVPVPIAPLCQTCAPGT